MLVLLAIAIARRITAPMAQLEGAAHAVLDGDLTVRAALAGPREVAAVAEEFNAMVTAQQLSDERLRAFLNNSAVIAWLKDEKGRHIFVSDNFLKRFALERDAVMGKTEHEIWPKAIADELRRNDRHMLDQGGTVEAIEAATDANGAVSWWLSNKFVFQGSDGQRLLGGLAVDVTARREAEQTLQASEARYRAVSQTANDAIATIDESDLPADYSASHIQIRLAQNGPVLTIGRVTGRILATDNGGKSIGSGRCTPITLI